MKPYILPFLLLFAAISAMNDAPLMQVQASAMGQPVKKTQKKKGNPREKLIAKLKKAGYPTTPDEWKDRRSPLARFAENGDAKAVKLIIDAGEELDFYKSGPVRKTALTLAIENGHYEVAKMLIKAGATAYFPSAHNNSLHAAAESGETQLVRLLIQYGANVNQPQQGTPGNVTPLMCGAGHPQMVSTLIDCGANVHAVDTAGHTVLHYAVKRNSPESVKILAEHHADPNARDNRGETPLFEAVRQNNPTLVDAVLRTGVDVTIKNQERQPAGAYIQTETEEGSMIAVLIYAAAKKQGAL